MSGQQQNPRTQLDYAGAIERVRRERGMTREALAETSGVSPSYLSEVERGFKRPSTDVLAAIARAMGMAPSELLAYVESSSPPLQTPPAAAMMPSPTTRRSRLTGMSDLSFFVASEPRQEAEQPSRDIDALVSVAKQLDPADIKVLVELARRLAAKRK
jgi:transcriptional regulator with XRE-family HTH domain